MKNIIYQERESRTLEFKEKIADYGKLAKTIVAFANGLGGTIIVGIEDKTRRVKGLTEDAIDKYFEEIPRAIFQIITPNLTAHLFERNYEGVSVLGIQIYPGDNKPYFITSEGHKRGVYVRVGSHTMRANEQFLEELNLQRENRAYDELLALRAQVNSLDKDIIEECFEQKISNHLLESNRIIGRDHISQQLFPTFGGVIMFHNNPSEILTEAYISCAHMRGTSGRNIIEFKDFHGPLVKISRSALELTANWLERDFSIKKGGELKGNLLVPFEALREGIYNAILHRKYNIPGPVKLTLWKDRLEIFSPGSFPGLMDMQNLGDGTTYIRNRALSLIARKIGLMEKRGTGIRLIIDSCKAMGDVEPIFEEGADWVKVTFKFLSAGQRKSMGIDGRFMDLLREKDLIRNRDVVDACMVSRETANKLIKKGIKRGLLQKDGEGRSTRYWVKEVMPS